MADGNSTVAKKVNVTKDDWQMILRYVRGEVGSYVAAYEAQYPDRDISRSGKYNYVQRVIRNEKIQRSLERIGEKYESSFVETMMEDMTLIRQQCLRIIHEEEDVIDYMKVASTQFGEGGGVKSEEIQEVRRKPNLNEKDKAMRLLKGIYETMGMLADVSGGQREAKIKIINDLAFDINQIETVNEENDDVILDEYGNEI